MVELLGILEVYFIYLSLVFSFFLKKKKCFKLSVLFFNIYFYLKSKETKKFEIIAFSIFI